MSTSTQAAHNKTPILGKVGLRIGKWKLLDVVGVGGFGEVWKAQEEVEGQSIGPPCAVKIMRLGTKGTGSIGNETPKAGWVQEINALKSILHDAIPRTFDGGIDESTGFAYISMELLFGETLAQRISRKRMGWRRALMIAEHIASALDAAHAQDVIHRDLKPQNVFLDWNGRVRVIDWGIAKLGRGPEITTVLPAKRNENESSETSTQEMSTQEQRNIALQNRPSMPCIVGTQGYIAPEIYEGAEPSASVDAYALGVVLYQCLTGRLPPTRAFSVDLWKATTEGQMNDLRELIADIPSGVRALVEMLLSQAPSERGAGTLVSRIAQVNRFPFGVPDPPYAGLNAFGADRAGFLFGRDAHVDRIVKRLEREHAVILSGPSGCGKSSLAIAGVAAHIDRIMLEGTDGWRLLAVRPSEPRALQMVRTHEAEGSDSLDAPIGTVVVVDQLEEVLGLESERRDAFCQALAALAERTDDVMVQGQSISRNVPLRLIATIRDDFEWQVGRIESLRNLCETSRCLVTGVDATSAREVVEEPAKALRYRLEQGNMVVREVETLLATDPMALPIVQFALSEWWARRDETKKELPATAWRELGGVEGALSNVADRHYRRLSAADQQALRDLFGRLLLGDRKQSVRADSLANDNERRLMDQLADLRLVRRRGEVEGTVGYELAHESLARHWDVLKQWIRERAAEDALIADLEIEAQLWARQGRPGDRLRPKMVVTENIRKRLHSDALAYVDASIDAGLQAERVVQRESIALSEKAAMQLDEVDAYLAHRGAEPMTVEDERRVSRSLTECRFGNMQALVAWKGNQAARLGLDQCLERMVAHEMRRRDLEGARALLAEFSVPRPELEKQVEVLAAEISNAKARDARLQTMERDADLRIGARFQFWVIIILPLWAIVMVVIQVVYENRIHDWSPQVLIGSPSVTLVLVLGTLAVVRRHLTTAISRHGSSVIILSSAGQVVHRMLAIRLGAPTALILVTDLLIAGSVCGCFAIALIPSMGWVAAVLLAGAVGATFFPALATHIFTASSVMALMLTTALWVQVTRRRDA